jgi:dTMP kinase
MGLFIAFDGGPGAGKGTMIKRTFEYIYDKSKKYDNILITDEPTNGPYGTKVRELLRKQKSSDDFKDELFELFGKDREWQVSEIISPSLEKDFVVIADRYKYSGIAYQAVQGTDFDVVFNRYKNVLAPDIAFILVASPGVAIERISNADDEKRKDTDKFREMEFVSNLQKVFNSLPEHLPQENIVIIDADKSKDEVFEQIKFQLDKILL